MSKKLFLSILTCFLTVCSTPLYGASKASIHLAWDYKQVPATMKIYELNPQKAVKLWDTGNASQLNQTPITTEIPNSTLSITPGEAKMFVLVLKNDTKQTLHFFAAPHSVNPPELSLGFKFKCLCIDHVYEVPAGQYWYRVVELRTAPNYEGNNVTITHNLIQVDPKRNPIPYQKQDHSHAME